MTTLETLSKDKLHIVVSIYDKTNNNKHIADYYRNIGAMDIIKTAKKYKSYFIFKSKVVESQEIWNGEIVRLYINYEEN